MFALGRSLSPLTSHTAASLNPRGRANLDLGVLLEWQKQGSGPWAPAAAHVWWLCRGGDGAWLFPVLKFQTDSPETYRTGSDFPEDCLVLLPWEGFLCVWSACAWFHSVTVSESGQRPLQRGARGLPGCALHGSQWIGAPLPRAGGGQF